MQRLNALLAALKTWVEAHALPVGVAGLVSVLAGGGIGIAALAGGGEAPSETTVAVPPAVVSSTTVQPSEEPDSTTATTAPPAGAGPTYLAVKVDNAPDARPQIGLDDAALVIETPVEGGFTRFLAFYQVGSYPRVVGPVRSLRPVDAALLAPFTSVVVASGGQPFVVGAVEGVGVATAGIDTAPGFQILERPDPYNLFVDLAQIEGAFPPAPADSPGFPAGELPEGESAEAITIPYDSEVRWEFAEGVYSRSEAGEPFEVFDDPANDTPARLTTDTVVVLVAAQRPAGYQDSNDVDVPTFDVVGSGRLLVFNGGRVVEGTWLRSAVEDPYRFFAVDGSEIGLPAGRTFVSVVGRELEIGF